MTGSGQNPGPCQWCGAPATARFEVTPAKYKPGGGVPELVKAAVTAPVCDGCNTRLKAAAERKAREQEEMRQLRREAKLQHRPKPRPIRR